MIRKGNKPARFETGDFYNWCLSDCQIPEDKDQAYIFAYHLNENDNTLRAAVSTKRLLELFILAGSFHIDTTHDLNCEKMPVAISGVSDKEKIFHPAAIFLMTGESENDYKFCFNSLVVGLHNLGYTFRPQRIISDCDSSISAAIRNTFDYSVLHIKCWFHVKKNITDRLKRVHDISKRDELINDINILQHSPSVEIFTMASDLFMDKWNTTADIQIMAFLNYFSTQYLSINRNWYEGIAAGYPSTNNGLESYNSIVKKTELLRSQLEIGII